MNGGRLGCGSLQPPAPRSRVARNRGCSSSSHGICTSGLAPRGVSRRLSGHVVRASGGNGDGSNPLLRPLVWLVDNIFPGLAPKLRQEQQHDVPQQRNQQQQHQQKQNQQSNRPHQSQQQQQERQISAEASGAPGDSAADSFAPDFPEPGFISELQGNPQQPGFWNVGTQLGIFSGNGQRALNSVMQRSNTGEGNSDAHIDSSKSIADIEAQEVEGNISMESWDQYMQQVDESSLRAMEVSSALDAAISDGRFEEAALLQKEADSFHAQDAVAVAHDKLELALKEDRFEDAARIRDEAFTNIVGWWAGRGNGDPYGHLMYVYRSHSSYVGKAIGGAQVAEYSLAAEAGQFDEEQLPAALQHAGMPLLELFIRQDERPPHTMRHCPAVIISRASLASDDGGEQVHMSGAFRIELKKNGQVVVVDSSDMSEVGNNQQIEGVLKAIVSAFADNMAGTSASDSGSSEEEAESSDDDEESDEGANATLEQATADAVLDSLRADVLRQLGADDEAVVIGTTSDTDGKNQSEFRRMFAEALKDVGVDQTEDGIGVFINVQGTPDGGSVNSNEFASNLVRGRADLRFFGRDRFALQACKNPSDPDNWNESGDDSSDDEHDSTDVHRSLEDILSGLIDKGSGSVAMKPFVGDNQRPRRGSTSSSSDPPATSGSIKIADFEDSDDSTPPSSSQSGTRGRRRRSGAPSQEDLDRAQNLREARKLARRRAQSQSKASPSDQDEKYERLKIQTEGLKKEQMRMKKRERALLRKLKEQRPEAYLVWMREEARSSIQRRNGGGSNDGGSRAGSNPVPLPVGSAGSQPDGVNTTELLEAGPITYSRIPSLGTTDDMEGVFLASYGDHGSEILLVQRSTDSDGQEWMTATKLTGDSNVPAGEVSFRAKIGLSKQLPPEAHMEMLGVTRRFEGEGRVASTGFTNPRWIPGDLLQFSPNNMITKGATTGIVWNLPERQPFLVVLQRVKLEDDIQDVSKRANRGT